MFTKREIAFRFKSIRNAKSCPAGCLFFGECPTSLYVIGISEVKRPSYVRDGVDVLVTVILSAWKAGFAKSAKEAGKREIAICETST